MPVRHHPTITLAQSDPSADRKAAGGHGPFGRDLTPTQALTDHRTLGLRVLAILEHPHRKGCEVGIRHLLNVARLHLALRLAQTDYNAACSEMRAGNAACSDF
jgi:hypothetical protein